MQFSLCSSPLAYRGSILLGFSLLCLSILCEIENVVTYFIPCAFLFFIGA